MRRNLYRGAAFEPESHSKRFYPWPAFLGVLALAIGLSFGATSPVEAQVPGTGDPPSSLDAQRGATECCLVLLLPVGARAVSLGRALTATSTPDAAFSNPAGLAGLEGRHFILHHTTLAGQSTALTFLVSPERVGTIGFSYQLVDFGEIEKTNDLGQTVGSLALRHHLLVASFASHLFGGLSAGLNYKLYRFRIGCTGQCAEEDLSASTHAVDAGLRYRPSGLPALQLGAAVTNIGFPLQVVNAKQADPLPTRIRVGAAYEVLRHVVSDSMVGLWFSLEIEDGWRDLGSPVVSYGMELVANDLAFLRAGYVPGDGVGSGAAIGVGIRYTRFTVSLAKSFATVALESDEEPVQVTFGLKF